MRMLGRLALQGHVVKALRSKQAAANMKRRTGSLNVEREWHAARKSKTLQAVLKVLQRMAGDRQRCMYCGDSHGTDIEHFWPKGRYPGRMFFWLNLLLCCSECGRLKGAQFPLAGNRPLLVDPTRDDPWQFLDFDPVTGNVVARFDAVRHRFNERGVRTVEILQLDRREALAASYLRPYRRLAQIVREALTGTPVVAGPLFHKLAEADDHGLLGWCFGDTSRVPEPFLSLKTCNPQTWAYCLRAVDPAARGLGGHPT